MPDKYDKAIAYLTQHPKEIMDAWYDGGVCQLPSAHPAACLFQYAGNSPFKCCGCLTMVKNGCRAETPELTKAIRADERIPNGCEAITLEHLPVFAEWQRRLDKELNRK